MTIRFVHLRFFIKSFLIKFPPMYCSHQTVFIGAMSHVDEVITSTHFRDGPMPPTDIGPQHSALPCAPDNSPTHLICVQIEPYQSICRLRHIAGLRARPRNSFNPLGYSTPSYPPTPDQQSRGLFCGSTVDIDDDGHKFVYHSLVLFSYRRFRFPPLTRSSLPTSASRSDRPAFLLRSPILLLHETELPCSSPVLAPNFFLFVV